MSSVHNTRAMYGGADEEVEFEEQGSASFAFVDGSKYEGDWVQIDNKRLRHGRGTYVDGSDTYEGEWHMDAIQGSGTYKYGSGAVYEGSWKQNEMCGEGTYKWVDGASYSGNWQGSKMHGKGQYTDPESVKWEGEFFNGKFFNGKAYVSLR